VSILREADPPARSGSADNTHHLAACCVGSGPRRSLAEGTRGYTHLLVAIDKFFKWIEVRPLNNIRSEQAVAFFTNIIHRFGVPNSIITDNGTQFTGRKFLDFCEDHHIRVDWATVAHPMTNGQVECANGMILQGLKPRIYNDHNKFGRRWMKELPSVVWSLRTTQSRATSFMSFFLVYGVEAILPTDLEYGSPRTRAYDDQSNRTNREDSLDQLEEARDMALLHSARYQQSLRRYHTRGVRSRDLQVGDLVLRLRQDARGRHKLTPPWEGPFIIAKILKPEHTSWPIVKARSTATLGTSDSYVASTLKMFSSRSYTSFTYANKV
jgi:transposase InsO family protein